MTNWFNSWLGRMRRDGERGQAHMTFGQTSLGRTFSRTRLLLKRQLWIWPIAALIFLSLIAYSVGGLIQRTMRNNLRSELTTVLSVERSMLEKWLKVQEASAVALANDEQIRKAALKIVEAYSFSARKLNGAENRIGDQELAELHANFIKELEPGLWSQGFVGFDLIDKQQRIISAYTTELIGQIVPQLEATVARALEGNPAVSAPFPSAAMLKDRTGVLRSGTPTMFVCSPIRDENLQVVAVLALRIRPEKEFTQILELGRIGDSGETYAVNREGLMASNSRFDPELILAGVLPDTDSAASILNLRICDPGGNLMTGYRPSLRRRELPSTKASEAAIAGRSGIDLIGYRSYRGVPVVGAWTSLPDYGLGLVTEIDFAEAYRPLTILTYSFYALYALLALAALSIFVFTLVVARLRREAQKAEIEAKQLGQYRLQEKIGAGAMGVVYKGQHAMLRRPTAIKMLNVDRVNEASIQRFEREVQITCKLNNPHTVAIYDYGRTPEGVFYYAMEYLDGINLQTLVETFGPQSEGRVAHILRQVCASLYEAHSLGLVHRDIKPANIMLNRRGGEPDVVKVLDFGLVKALDDDKRGEGNDLSGTPLYMSPEAIQSPALVDTRSDLYAVGAVGYFLLTGETAFSAQTLRELCQQHLNTIPEAPSRRLKRPISEALEHAILACLEKDRAKRPQTARDFSALLERAGASWSLEEADAWWGRYERGQHATMQSSSAPTNAGTGGAGSQDPLAVRGAATIKPTFDRTAIFQSPEESEPELDPAKKVPPSGSA